MSDHSSTSPGWLLRFTDSDIWWSFKSSKLTVVAALAWPQMLQ